MSLKLLIVEGPDRVGKSTLIKNLCIQASNSIVRHFGIAKGENDFEKRNYQYQFFKKEFQLAAERNKFDMSDKCRYPRDIYIFDRGHLGEFVYGNMYRDTKPDDWVMRMETDFSFDIDPSVYLVLLYAPAEFLCSHDDGLSFSDKIENRQDEIRRFEMAYEQSKIMHKLKINVANPLNDAYRPEKDILDDVNEFLFNNQIN